MSKHFAAGVLVGVLAVAFLAFFLLPVFTASVVTSPSAEDQILELIDSARNSIYIECYIITSEEVVDHLIQAKQRGVEVKVILEERTSSSANALAYSRLAGAGVDVCWASEAYKLTHSKLMIIDKNTALLGSHNLSYSALNLNREISVVLQGNIVGELLEIFDYDWNACTLNDNLA